MRKGLEKILVVNDCKLEQIIIKDILIKLGYDVKIGDEYGAINTVKKFLPSIVIVNLIMKNTTGDVLIKEIKEFSKNIRCILSSSNPLKLEEFEKMKVDATIQTPVDNKSLLDVLKSKPQIKFCINCGAELENKFKSKVIFCPYCGIKL